MAFADVQTPFRQTGTGASTYNTAYPTDNLAHKLLLLELDLTDDGSAATNIASVTDTAGNTWQYAGSSGVAGLNERKHLYFVPDSIAGPNTVTVNLNSAINAFRLIREISGADLVSPLVVFGGGNGAASKPTANTGATSVPQNSLLVAGAVSSGAIVQTTGWTESYNTATNWFEQEQSLFDSGVAGTQTVNWDATSGSGSWSAYVAAFKAAGSASLFSFPWVRA